jgi:hypothetical protein
MSDGRAAAMMVGRGLMNPEKSLTAPRHDKKMSTCVDRTLTTTPREENRFVPESRACGDALEAERDSGAMECDDPMETGQGGQGGSSSSAPPSALWYLRQAAYIQCKKNVQLHTANLIRQGLPGLANRREEAEAVVERLSRQLAAWAAHGETPPDLIQERQEAMQEFQQEQQQQQRRAAHASTPDFDMPMTAADGTPTDGSAATDAPPPLLRGRRERDAVRLLQAQQGQLKTVTGEMDDGPLPINNTALQDLHQSQDPSDHGTARKRKRAMISVLSLLARALLGQDPKTGRDKPVTSLLKRTRELASGDGVFMTTAMDNDPDAGQVARVILVRAAEVERILRAPNDKVDNFMTETKELLDAWRQEHGKHVDSARGYLRKPLGADVLAPYANPPAAGKGALGLECRDRQSFFYRAETCEPASGMPPIRAGVPLSRDLLVSFVYRHLPQLHGRNLWQLVPDMVMPTCPLTNQLLDGVTPWHMGLYAMLDEYTVLMRNAIDRVSTPGVRPPQPDGPQGVLSGFDLERAQRPDRLATLSQRGVMCCSVLRKPIQQLASEVPHCGSLPDWCGQWFFPLAFLPIPSNQSELDLWYPKDDPALHPWLRQLVSAPALQGKSYTARLDAFDQLCKEADRQVGIKEQEQKQAQKQEQNKKPLPEMRPEIQAFIDRINNPDMSREGRAETLLGLVISWLHTAMLRKHVVDHSAAIDNLRTLYKDHVTDCGNGYSQVRPPLYYDHLFTLCQRYAANVLEAYELCLLLINLRWIDGTKAVHSLVPIKLRVDSTYMAKAHPDVVKNTLERRQDCLHQRQSLDDKAAQLRKGMLRPPPHYHQQQQPQSPQSNGAWIWDKLAQHRMRPDCPTYADMILFDHLIEASNTSSGSGNTTDATLQDRDPSIDALSQRFRKLVVDATERAKADPAWVLKHHGLPGNRVPTTAVKHPRVIEHEPVAAAAEPGKSAKTGTATKRRRRDRRKRVRVKSNRNSNKDQSTS